MATTDAAWPRTFLGAGVQSAWRPQSDCRFALNIDVDFAEDIIVHLA
jgi:hypothetical protein